MTQTGKRAVWLAQPNYRFGENAFLPYSVGRVWAYAAAQSDIASLYRLAGILWEREPIDQVVARMGECDVLALSCYIWNWEYNLALAQAVKSKFPNSLVVIGGPQVPKKDTALFLLHHYPYLDVAVLGEGERSFVAVLRQIVDFTLQRVYAEDRLDDLATLPSPYLTGLFDDLLRRSDIKWQALQETNRGCPYQCTFCDWGSATYSKVRKFPLHSINLEIAWFAANKIELLYNCDANFGMLEQDEAIADTLIEAKRFLGYPQKFRAAYAKKITERVFSVSKKLADAGMSKGATISFQSLHEPTLNVIKRLNPVQKSLAETFAKYNKANIATYTELIIGLPGETLGTFADGIEQLLEAGQHTGLAIYPCMMLKNSEMSEPLYREAHGIEIARCRQLLMHGTAGIHDVPEWYDLVIATSTMPHEDWRQAYELGWIVMALHCTGLTTELAKAVRVNYNKYNVSFYANLLAFADALPHTSIGRELQNIRRMLDRVLAGDEWATVDEQFGDVSWPPEELSYLRLLLVREEFTRDVHNFLSMTDWYDTDMHRLLLKEAEGWPNPFHKAWGGDLKLFAREVVWYGRKGGIKYKNEVKALSTLTVRGY